MRRFSIRFITILLLSIFCISAFSSCGGKQKREEAWKEFEEIRASVADLDSVEESQRPGFIQKADRCAEIADTMKEDAKKAEALAIRGWILGLMFKLSQAEEAFKEALTLAPTSNQVYFFYGKTYYHNREWSKALEKFGDALTFSSPSEIETRIEIVFYQADILETLEYFGRAEKKYAELVELADKYAVENDIVTEGKKRLRILERE